MTVDKYEKLTPLERAKIIRALPDKAECPFPPLGKDGEARCTKCPLYHNICPQNRINGSDSPVDWEVLDAYIAEHDKEPKMKYKVGDKVLVCSTLVEGKEYGKCAFVQPMVPFVGQVVTIAEVVESIKRYHIEGLEWFWTDEMFVGKADDLHFEEKAPILAYAVGDRVQIRPDLEKGKTYGSFRNLSPSHIDKKGRFGVITSITCNDNFRVKLDGDAACEQQYAWCAECLLPAKQENEPGNVSTITLMGTPIDFKWGHIIADESGAIHMGDMVYVDGRWSGGKFGANTGFSARVDIRKKLLGL